MDRGVEQSFMVNRVVTGDSIQKFSPERTSTKSNSTNSSNSAIGNQDKKTPFLIGVAGGTASGKVSECRLLCIDKSILKLTVLWLLSNLFYE